MNVHLGCLRPPCVVLVALAVAACTGTPKELLSPDGGITDATAEPSDAVVPAFADAGAVSEETDSGALPSGDAGSDGGSDAGAPPVRPPAGGGPNSFGYIGCSMARNTFDGWRLAGGTQNWPGYDTGGGVLGRWADASSSYWASYDGMVRAHGQPDNVLVQVCTFSSATSATLDHLRAAVAILRSRSPSATVYIGWQPEYAPGHVCTILGRTEDDMNRALARVRDIAMAGVAEGLGMPDPASPLGPLGGSTTRDSCHASEAGQAVLGDDMVAAYGR